VARPGRHVRARLRDARRCLVLQLFPDRDACSRWCGRAVRAERLTSHRLSPRNSAGPSRPYRCLAPARPYPLDDARGVPIIR
jgi:hypothetical protein